MSDFIIFWLNIYYMLSIGLNLGDGKGSGGDVVLR